ncbi:hypothetical protein C0W35_21260 [Photobacterium kishitanii]|nr:hypothetical protein C0W35_21260 [Photobacterium kishitanii]
MIQTAITNKVLNIKNLKSFSLSCLLCGVIMFLIIMTMCLILMKIIQGIITQLIDLLFTRN